ncbi:glycosyltransferase, partial [Candidatus Microgenomates bacterium]|nr:glycosyltransferase [Candidatus Microgenomates bacterium]
MKVAYFTDFFLPAINGVITSILNVSAGLIDRGHDVTIYAPKSKINPDHLPKNLHVRLIPSVDSYIYPQWRFALPMTPAMLMAIKNDKPDILH